MPLGDFFGVGHARTTNFVSVPLQMSPESGKAFNCFFQMPFAGGARIEVTSELDHEKVVFYYYVDYEELDTLEEDSAASTPSGAGRTPRTGVRGGGQSNAEYRSAART